MCPAGRIGTVDPACLTGVSGSWNMYPSGGHFAAHKAPNELIADMRAFYRPLR
jgi:hypothetical protein